MTLWLMTDCSISVSRVLQPRFQDGACPGVRMIMQLSRPGSCQYHPKQSPRDKLPSHEGGKNHPPGTIIVYKTSPPGTKRAVKDPTTVLGELYRGLHKNNTKMTYPGFAQMLCPGLHKTGIPGFTPENDVSKNSDRTFTIIRTFSRIGPKGHLPKIRTGHRDTRCHFPKSGQNVIFQNKDRNVIFQN